MRDRRLHCSDSLPFYHVASKLALLYLIGISLCSLSVTCFTPFYGFCTKYTGVSSHHTRRICVDSIDCRNQEDITLICDFEENKSGDTYCADRDSVLSLLQSPAPESFYVIEMFVKNLEIDSIQSLEALLDTKYLSKTLVNPGFQIELSPNKMVSNVHKIQWSIVPRQDDEDENSARKGRSVNQQRSSLTTLDLAHAALKLTMEASLKNERADQYEINLILVEAKVSRRSNHSSSWEKRQRIII